ncbi:hypothetical protein [Arthrobacter sp. efr-133-TYG-118]|uniref:hypothetical protein n=1 Tax=Arthrobacter sp. efr-133-TYG-118 TaxID=3040279 RepID=UPI003305627E
MLADHGAEGFEAGTARGGETRSWGPPFVSDIMSAYFSGVNRNKYSPLWGTARNESMNSWTLTSSTLPRWTVSCSRPPRPFNDFAAKGLSINQSINTRFLRHWPPDGRSKCA